MSNYFDRLEAELRAAVPRAVEAPAQARRRLRIGNGTAPALVGAVVALAVVVIAVLLVGHSNRTPQPTPAKPAPASAVPTLRQLLDNFVTLRRAQTAADRSWRPPAGSLYGARYLPGLTRLARTLPNRDRVFLTIEQIRIPGGDWAKGSYAMDVWVVGPDGKFTSSGYGPTAQYTVLPLQFPAPGGPRTVPPGGLQWTGVVPDGVRTVRWTFVCNPLARNCAGQRAVTLTVRVRSNIATTQLPGSGRCGTTPASCLRPSIVTWYDSASGQVVATYTAKSVMTAPPFVLRPAPPPVNGVPPKVVSRRILNVLSGRSIGRARFGDPLGAVRAAIDSLLGQQGGRSRSAGGDCGVDHQITWSDQWSASGYPSLTAYFARDRLIGYQYGEPGAQVIHRLPAHGPVLATARGLTIGDTLERGRNLYGSAFQTSAAQGGSWRVNTKSGRIDGYASDVPHPGNLNALKVVTIDAGTVGCPAVSP